MFRISYTRFLLSSCYIMARGPFNHDSHPQGTQAPLRESTVRWCAKPELSAMTFPARRNDDPHQKET
jgi:hypothetical protein